MKNYKDFKELEDDIQENEIMEDLFMVDNIIYTQDCYDMGGQEISFGNKKHSKGFIVNTKNRYKEGFKDATISILDENNYCFRNDITYYE